MPNPIEAQIQERIQNFVRELDMLVRKSTLDSLRSLLERGPSAPARAGRGPGRPRGSARGASVDAAADAIAAHVQSNDGQNVGQIAQATGIAPPVAKKAIIRLLAAGRIKKSGAKRGTRYHPGSGRAPARVGKAGRRGRRRGRKAKAA